MSGVPQFPKHLPGCFTVTIDTMLFPFGVGPYFGLAARTMEVQIVVEMFFIELLHARRLRRRDVNIAHMLPNHRSVLGFHQSVVIGSPRPALGLFDQ